MASYKVDLEAASILENSIQELPAVERGNFDKNICPVCSTDHEVAISLTVEGDMID